MIDGHEPARTQPLQLKIRNAIPAKDPDRPPVQATSWPPSDETGDIKIDLINLF